MNYSDKSVYPRGQNLIHKLMHWFKNKAKLDFFFYFSHGLLFGLQRVPFRQHLCEMLHQIY